MSNTLSINLTTGRITASDPLAIRKTAVVTLTGTGSYVNTNMRLAVMWKGAVVAQCSTFTGPADAFVGSLDLNTVEMVAVMTTGKARDYEKKVCQLVVYDASTIGFVVNDRVDLRNTPARDTDVLPGNVTPITTGTLVWGNLMLKDGVSRMYNPTTGHWHKYTMEGSGAEIHYVLWENDWIDYP